MANEAEVGKALASAMPLYANYHPPADDLALSALTSAWHNVVGHLEPDVLQAAMTAAATRTQFFPTPSLVLECATELTVGPLKSGAEAWGELQAAIQEHHWNHPPDGAQAQMVTNYFWTFSDPAIGKVVKALGWANLCLSENQMSDRSQFIRAYEVECARARETAKIQPLTGAVKAPLQLTGSSERREISAATEMPVRSRPVPRDVMAKIGNTRRAR